MIEVLTKCLKKKQLRNARVAGLFTCFDSNTLEYNKLNKQ